ncbi:MAG: hypothetical protein RLZZ414_1270 [Bacteroidota bacterium]|jgi:hypothetical protein
MKSTEIQNSVQTLIDNFSPQEFIYDLLMAYGISKTSVTRLKKGDYNLSQNKDEVLYKKKVFFKTETSDKLLSSIELVAKDDKILKHQPRFAILTDFNQLVAKDLKLNKNLDIPFKELPNYFDFFLPLAGSEVYNSSNNNEADRNASYKMASLYDLLIEENPDIYNSKESIHHLNIFLSRLLFCFFAEDTGIFKDTSIFTDTLVQHTDENGTDTHIFLNDLFDRLATNNVAHLPQYLQKFEYVNGGLFSQKINSPKFTAKARKTLIELGELQWRDINPDIFGSMIQAVVIPEYRSDLGMHYTSVENILKLIKPLFLDELYEAYENATTIKQLRELIFRISKIKFFDPACGSGNFLIITYKEIRFLEILILEKIIELEGTVATIKWTAIELSQFYGIEIDDFAHEMAILSLWLAEHQMNKIFEERLFDYGKSKPILPLKEAGKITQGNATRVDWKMVCPISDKDEVYVIGNPPYLGSRNQDKDQKEDMSFVFRKDYKALDYVSIWFYKGVNYIEGFNAKIAFVSTNSICQGEQVALLWPKIYLYEVELFFAYQSFKWTNNAKGNAGVEVVIIGLRNKSDKTKFIFNVNLKTEVNNINPYLTNNKIEIINKRSKPLSFKNSMIKGCYPTDGGGLIIKEDEYEKFKNSDLKNNIHPFIGTSEFIKGIKKWCIYLNDTVYELLKENKLLNDRLNIVVKSRNSSKKLNTQKLASVPYKFEFDSTQKKEGIIIPCITSQRREYLPVGFIDDSTIVYGTAQVLYTNEPYIFGVLSSKMHMAWIALTCGRMKTDYNYSSTLCYNTFPFPDITTKQKENLNLYVFAVLDERAKHPSKTMAQLYNPSTMPKGLLQAHQELDTAIEQCYRLQPFKNDTERLEYLFKMYETMVNDELLMINGKWLKKKKK